MAIYHEKAPANCVPATAASRSGGVPEIQPGVKARERHRRLKMRKLNLSKA